MYGCNKPFWPLPYAKAYSLELDWILEELRKVQEGGGTNLDNLIKSIEDIKSELESIVASPGIVYDAQNLGGVAADNYALKTDTAPNSLKLGGVAAGQYALKTDTAPDSLKLGGVAAGQYALKTDTAPDSLKLGGKPGSEYANAKSLRQLKDDLTDLQTKTGINYLRPSLGTTTINGVTCTNNGDGTYTLNGTSTDVTVFVFVDKDRWLQNAIVGKTVKFNCVQDGSSSSYFAYIYALAGHDISQFDSNGVIFTPTNAVDYNITFQIMPNVTVNNIVVKPMITDDLSATYDDFVSYDDSFVKGSDVIDKSSIGDVWAAGTTYAEGDCRINGNRLYKCKTAHTAGSAFDVIYWDAVSIADQLAKIITAMNIRI